MEDKNIVLSDYLSGGYYITKYVERPSYVSQVLLPGKILSISDNFCNYIPDSWTISWTRDELSKRLEMARYFGLSAEELKEVTEWATDHFDKEFGVWNIFYSLEGANKFKDRFLSKQNDLIILGIGLHKSYNESFLNTAQPPPQQPGYAPVGETGIYTCVKKKMNLEPGGDILGFELVILQYGLLTCSWLYNELEKVFHDKLNITPNKEGFIDTFESASECADLISKSKIDAEPGLWLPWLIIKYS